MRRHGPVRRTGLRQFAQRFGLGCSRGDFRTR